MPPPINIEEYLDSIDDGLAAARPLPSKLGGPRAVGIGVGRLKPGDLGQGTKCRRPIVQWG